MRRRDIIFVIFGTLLTVVFIRLGFWQLSRLSDRKVFNRELAARAMTAPVPLSALPRDTGAMHYRRVGINGVYDYAHEILIATRTRNGSPGVQIVTPVRRAGNDTAVLVTRGWVYAPDGMTIDRKRWQEGETLSGEAFVENFTTGTGKAELSGRDRLYRRLDYSTLPQD